MAPKSQNNQFEVGRVDVVLPISQGIELRHSKLPNLSPKYQLVF